MISLARPELLDIRPGWGGGRVRATSIELEPLGPNESEQLIDALDDTLDPSERQAVLAKTEGNPLFVEETVRMLAEEGADGIGRIPDTLQALIAARIDRLAPEAKALLQRAAVVGRIFWEGAIERLSPELESLEGPLDDLRLREFVLDEERSSIRGEKAYKFKHVLIREVAYAGLSKSARAEHHARFAGWLKERAGEELLEIRAFHLDRATALLAELDGAAPVELQREAAEALAEAGLRAFAREANRSARTALRPLGRARADASAAATWRRARPTGSAICLRSHARWRRCSRPRSPRATAGRRAGRSSPSPRRAVMREGRRAAPPRRWSTTRWRCSSPTITTAATAHCGRTPRSPGCAATSPRRSR